MIHAVIQTSTKFNIFQEDTLIDQISLYFFICYFTGPFNATKQVISFKTMDLGAFFRTESYVIQEVQE